MTLRELARRTWRETNDDNVFGRAAELSYYFLLALFPMLIFLSSLVGFLPDAQANIFRALARVMPGDAMRLVHETISDVARNRSGGLLSFGVLGALWAASGGVSAVMGALNDALYLRYGPSYSATYGSLGAVIALMLWLYLMGAVVLIGGEVNAELRHAAGKAVFQKETSSPGESHAVRPPGGREIL